MHCCLLGGLEVTAGGEPLELGGPKQRAVLAVLLLHAGRPLSADVLIDRVWGEEPPARVHISLQAYISNLRRALEPERRRGSAPSVLVSRRAGYAVEIDPDAVDVHRLDHLAMAITTAADEGRHADVVSISDTARAMWRGPLLPEFAGLAWVDERQVQLDRTYLAIRRTHAETLLTVGHPDGVLAIIEPLLIDHPYDEHLYALAATADYQLGNQRAALARIHDARQRLIDEIGIDLGPELRHLEHDVLAQADSLQRAPRSRLRQRATSPTTAAEPLVIDTPAAATPSPARSGHPFFGRATELERLATLWQRASTAEGQVVVIGGAPGVGKTRLVEEAIERITPEVMAWGRCPESAAQAPYFPLSQVMRQLEGAGILNVDYLSSLAIGGDAADPGERSARRLELHQAVGDSLAGASKPSMVVLDDLQWADPASLRLVEFVAGDLWRSKVMLVITVRQGDDTSNGELRDCLAELSRHSNMIRLDLGGLSASEVREWLLSESACGIDDSVADTVMERTAGNAYFVREIAQLLAAGAAADGLPSGVNDAVRRHVARLPDATQRLLPPAGLIGRYFDSATLATVLGMAQIDVVEGLEPAAALGLIEPGESPGVFRFTHAITAEAMVAELGPARRARLHAMVAEAMVARGDDRLQERIPYIAHHALLGAPAGTATLAYQLSVRAANLATMQLSDEQAVEHWQRAIEALDADPGDTASARLDATIELGRTYVRLYNIVDGAAVLLPAVRIALEAGDLPRAVAAARALAGQSMWHGEAASLSVDATNALLKVLDALPDTDSVDRVALLDTACEYGYWILPTPNLHAMSGAAVEAARRLGDDAGLVRGLVREIQNPGRWLTTGIVAQWADELDSLADNETLAHSLRAVGHLVAASVAWNAGEVTLVRRRLASARSLATRGRSVDLEMMFTEHALLLWSGDLGGALRLLDDGEDAVRRWRAPTLRMSHDHARAATLIELDREAEAYELMDRHRDSAYGIAFRTAAARWCAEAGQSTPGITDASALHPASDRWIAVPLDTCVLASRALLGVTDGVEELITRLDGFSFQLAVVGGGLCYGDVDLAIALGHHVIGDAVQAEAAIHRSVERMHRTGAGPWLVRSLWARGRILGRQADIAAALDVARRDGCRRLERLIQAQ